MIDGKVIRSAVEVLSEKIREMEEYLCSIPCKVETNMEIDGRGVRFCRVGVKWKLEVCRGLDWEPASSCGIEVKLSILRSFEDILKAMTESQVNFVDRVNSACSEFNAKLKALTGTR